jgi:hypothetical protein
MILETPDLPRGWQHRLEDLVVWREAGVPLAAPDPAGPRNTTITYTLSKVRPWDLERTDRAQELQGRGSDPRD